MRDDPDRAAKAGRASAVVDVAGMDDQAGGEVEHLSREREVLGPVLPQRRNALLHHGVPEQPRGQPAIALEGVQVRLPVAASERDARDEVMQHEVVEHDEPRRPAQRIDDPTVGIGVVPDVKDAEIRSPRRLLRPPSHRHDLASRLERRQQEGRVVGDSRPLGGHRAEDGDLHDNSRPIARSHVTSAATAWPARPSAAASSG